MSPINIVLTLATLLITLHLASSLKCYDCEGYLDRDLACEIDVEKEATPSCAENEVCLKFILKDESGSLLKRSCNVEDACTLLENKYENLPIYNLTECITCESDLCNSSTLTISSVFIVISALTTGIFFI